MIIRNSRERTQKDHRTNSIGCSARLSPFAAKRPSSLKSGATHFGIIRLDLVGFTRINPDGLDNLEATPTEPLQPCLPSPSAFFAAANPTGVDSIYFDLVGFGWICPAQPNVWESLKAAPLRPASPVKSAIQTINLPENGLIWSDSVGSARQSAVPSFRPAESAASPAFQSGLANAIGLG